MALMIGDRPKRKPDKNYPKSRFKDAAEVRAHVEATLGWRSMLVMSGGRWWSVWRKGRR
jgi:hypothetical protein